MNVVLRLMLLLSVGLCSFPAGADATLKIYYTASLNGNLDGCNCDMNPVAGLVKRAAFLRNLEPTGPALLLDAGDIFDEYPDPDLERQILEVYEELGYDAIALGDQELAAGARVVRKHSTAHFLICHNLSLPAGRSEGDLFTSTPVVVERGGLRIAIIALLDPSTVNAAAERGIEISEPVSTARLLMASLQRSAADLTFLLYHGPFRSAAARVEACPGIDVVIFAHEQQLVAPRKVGSTVFASPGKDGDHLGILTLHLGTRGIEKIENEFRFFSYTKDPDDPAVRSRIESYRNKLRSYLY
jgi:2',3'-cyclic-nucleotide 2'-phosphodiesterase (5'-nucleotidase family)